jgi:hypothetical protein
MVKHIVMFRLLDFAEGNTKETNANIIKEKLGKLPSLIKEITGFEIGINYFQSERAADLVLISTFETKEDLEYYRTNPDHLKVAEFIMKVRKEIWVVDFEE